MKRARSWLVSISLAAATQVLAVQPAAVPQSAIAGGRFESVFPPAPGVKTVEVPPYRMDTALVSNADYATFVRRHPEWRRDRVAGLFADEGYLRHWSSATEPGEKIARQPVTQVSWFAASAYCEARDARLPRWDEWELAAAASTTKPDARDDPAWRQQILDWYSTSARGALPAAGASPANYFGVRDLHGVAWEWVEDAGSMLVSDDSREQGDPNRNRFCGSGALSLDQKDNYAMMMRIAMLSSMKASYSSSSMGFRCASDSAAQR
ncbi:MAG TPA: formylglycine-generating enzyme family protein [Steroidobacteraceae bacterium]|nr:formylglycine-generating enzyme family protein [Steroidobacteraceae bacterium]